MMQSALIFSRLLSLETVHALGNYAKNQLFEVSADAFESLKVMLTMESALVSPFLEHNYWEVVGIIDGFSVSENYFLKRQSLSLLNRLLGHPKNAIFVEYYSKDSENLKRIMTAMKKETSRQVKLDAFCVFAKIVEWMTRLKPEERGANLSVKIVRKNRERLGEFVGEFGRDVEDEKFQEVKQHLMSALRLI